MMPNSSHPTTFDSHDRSRPEGDPEASVSSAGDSPVPDQTQRHDEAGMTTAEYAVGTLAAVAFAVVLMTVVRSDAVQSGLAAVIQAALAMGR